MKQTLIGIVGLRRSGKDTAAEALVEARNFKLIKFADGLKGMLRHYLRYIGLEDEVIDQMLEGFAKEIPTSAFQGKTPRWAMQSLGTEWGRDLIGANIWRDAALQHARLYSKVVISDCRFPNEAEAIKAEGGTIIRIFREGLPIDAHPSESLIHSIKADIYIENDGTVSDLKRKVLQETEKL